MRFRVLTWNCFGMAQGGFDAVMGGRAPAGNRLSDPHVLAECAGADIVALQEILSGDAEQLFDRVKGANAGLRDHNRWDLRSRTARGTGLGLGVRGELGESELRPFDNPSVGWDRLARKGTLHGRVTLPGGLVLDVVTTHLQSGYDVAAEQVRTAQLAQVARLVERAGSPERPMLVVGDFNINGLRPHRQSAEYRRLRDALPGFDDTGADSDLVTFHPHPDVNPLAHLSDPGAEAQRIDYIFFRPARSPSRALRCAGVDLTFTSPLEATREQHFAGVRSSRAFASDHFGLGAWFEVDEP